MNNILGKNNNFQKNKFSEKSDIVFPLMSGLIEKSWISIHASAVNLVYVFLMTVYEENPASHSYTVGKDSNISI